MINHCRIGKVTPKNKMFSVITPKQTDEIKDNLKESYLWAMQSKMPFDSYALVLWDKENFEAMYSGNFDAFDLPHKVSEILRNRIYKNVIE